MEKVLILLISSAGLVAAGVLDTRWTSNEGRGQNNERIRDSRIREINLDPILQMSSEELERQKLLLTVIDHVHQPLQDEELLRTSDAFVADQSKYRKGIDGDMLHVIELSRNLRLLGKNEVCTISNEEHLRQLVGLYGLFVRANDWETFKQNVCCARMHVNGVLFVSALMLAVRERNDTRMLIIPGLHEILPEMYLDREIVRSVRDIDLNLLTRRTEDKTIHQNFLDMVGLNGRRNLLTKMSTRDQGIRSKPQLWMPWREMRMNIAMQKTPGNMRTLRSDVDDKIVIPVENNINSNPQMNLLTGDVGLKGFLHLMVNDLCLRESKIQRSNLKIDHIDTNRNVGLSMLDRDRLLVGRNEESGRRTQIFDGDRLVSRRYEGKDDDDGDESERWTESGIRDGRRVTDGLETQEDSLHSSYLRSRSDSIDKQYGRMQTTGGLRDLPSTTIDDDKLLHVNRRRLSSVDSLDLTNGATRKAISPQDRLMQNIHDSRRTVQRNHEKFRSAEDRLDRSLETNSNRMNLPTTTIDDERLLHVNRKKLSAADEIDQRNDAGRNQPSKLKDRFLNILHMARVHDGRRTIYRREDELQGKRLDNNLLWEGGNQRSLANSVEDMDTTKTIWRQEQLNDQKDNLRGRNDNQYDSILKGRQTIPKMQTQSDLVDSIDDGRLLHISRRRVLRKAADTERKNMMRREVNNEIWPQKENNIWQSGGTDDDSFIGIRRTSIQNDRLLHVNRRHLNDIGDIIRRRPRDIRDLLSNNNELDESGLQSDVLLHNIRQTLARLEMDRISLRITSQMVSNSDLSMSQSRDLEEETNNRINIDSINDIEKRILLVLDSEDLTKDTNVPLDIDRRIGDILLGRNDKISILKIVSNIVSTTKSQRIDEPSLLDLGIDLKNPLIQVVLSRLMSLIDIYRTNALGAYTRDELSLDGVFINDITVDQFKTVIDNYDTDIYNLLDEEDLTSRGNKKMIAIRQQRLNHKDFTIKINLNSDRNRRVVIRTLLGPKLIDKMGRELSLEERRKSFILIDTNLVDLKSGKNVIKRKSRDIAWTAPDTTPFTKIYERVMMAQDSNLAETLPLANIAGQDCRFPHRLLLPRGSINGVPMELLVMVSPLESDVIVRADMVCAMGVGFTTSDGRSLGFPLDRLINRPRDWLSLSNMLITNVTIDLDDRTNMGRW